MSVENSDRTAACHSFPGKSRSPEDDRLLSSIRVLAAAIALYLCPPAPLRQVGIGSIFGRLTHLYFVHYRGRARAFGHPRCCPLVLDDIGFAGDGGNSTLHVHFEVILIDLGSGEAGPNLFLEL